MLSSIKTFACQDEVLNKQMIKHQEQSSMKNERERILDKEEIVGDLVPLDYSSSIHTMISREENIDLDVPLQT